MAVAEHRNRDRVGRKRTAGGRVSDILRYNRSRARILRTGARTTLQAGASEPAERSLPVAQRGPDIHDPRCLYDIASGSKHNCAAPLDAEPSRLDEGPHRPAGGLAVVGVRL